MFGRALAGRQPRPRGAEAGDRDERRGPRLERSRAAARRRLHPHAERAGGPTMNAFSFARLIALLRKESIQILRDTMTLRIIIAIPIMQLFLFGYAINSDPKHLPAGLLVDRELQIHPHHRRRAEQFGLLRHPGHPIEAEAERGARARRADVRHPDAAGLRPSGRPRRAAKRADRRRRDRSDRDRQRGRGARPGGRRSQPRPAADPPDRSRRRRHSSSSCTPATIPSS